MESDKIKRDKRRSIVWKYFNRLDRSRAACSICERVLQTCGNTTNLKHHLVKIHKITITSSDRYHKPLVKLELQKYEKEDDFDETEEDFNQKLIHYKIEMLNQDVQDYSAFGNHGSTNSEHDDLIEEPEKSSNSVEDDMVQQRSLMKKEQTTNDGQTSDADDEVQYLISEDLPNNPDESREHLKKSNFIDDDIEIDEDIDEMPPPKRDKLSWPSNLNQTDSFMVFGIHVAHELKKIPSEYTLQLAKHKINKILFEATTTHLNKN